MARKKLTADELLNPGVMTARQVSEHIDAAKTHYVAVFQASSGRQYPIKKIRINHDSGKVVFYAADMGDGF